MCDDCWQFFFKPPVTKHRTVSNDVKSMRKRDNVSLSSFRSVSAKEMSRAFARRIFRNFLSQDAMFSLPGVNDTTRDDIRNHLQEAPSHLFRFVQESVFRELRENEFNRFIQLKHFRNLQKCSIWHDDENKNLNTTHHLKMQYRSMGAMLHSNASSGTTTTTGTTTTGRNVRSVGGRSSTYKPKASFATLEEWEKSSAWMDLERVPADYLNNESDDDGRERNKSTSGSSRKSNSFSSNSMTPRSGGASLLFRSSVGVLFTPPIRPTASLDVVHEEDEKEEEKDSSISKIATSSRISSSSDIGLFDGTTTSTPPREISKDENGDVILKGWLSCRLVIPWLSVVSSKDFVREDYEKEAEIGMYYVVLRSDGTLRRFVDETMRTSSGPSIDVKLRVYDVSWTKETGASEQSFEIATKDGIYIFSLTSSGENQVTALKWMRSIRALCMSLISLSPMIDRHNAHFYRHSDTTRREK